MSLHQYAKILGRRGGQARAKTLSAEQKKNIAAQGAKARIQSLQIAQRIETNFRYLKAIHELSLPPKVKSRKTAPEKLPGVYV
ncbi:MAG: hypothetical protein COX62_08075 [Deltaproteobacteria bacterium CG_4_10_14_0_2_um_filter_43_8]|nr:MAG: hypothetical protein COV43_06565 [Deltaproteobacteria bacterium CG11_big_fil_rev_8_21_14_0_20_42_23]PJA18831.1 MAG: hypothetical protein COX62_08075 [Deltaproteobacteria bacterium CG_4_10_14_0_2_um_filter_43_8]PJC64851.1 MAG: hypothetical protein CO021_02205 [Deltaproteobacteria bacterium CG_4_9_14_0_2_um_filter_42_21]